jgi:hypothetical protein
VVHKCIQWFWSCKPRQDLAVPSAGGDFITSGTASTHCTLTSKSPFSSCVHLTYTFNSLFACTNHGALTASVLTSPRATSSEHSLYDFLNHADCGPPPEPSRRTPSPHPINTTTTAPQPLRDRLWRPTMVLPPPGGLPMFPPWKQQSPSPPPTATTPALYTRTKTMPTRAGYVAERAVQTSRCSSRANAAAASSTSTRSA